MLKQSSYPKFLSVLFVIIISNLSVLCQKEAEIDSLKWVLEQTKEGNSKFETYYSLVDVYRFFQSDSALVYALLAEKEAEKYKNPIDISHAKKALADVYTKQGQLEKAEKIAKENIQALRQSKNDSLLCWQLLNFGLTADKSEALGMLHEALEIAKKIADPKAEAACYVNLSTVFMDNKEDFDIALSYMERAIEIQKKHQIKEDLVLTYLNLGALYGKHSQFEELIRIEEEAIPILKEIQDYQHLSIAYNHLGLAHGFLEQFEKAEFYHKAKLELAKQFHNKVSTYENLVGLAAFYQQTKQYEKGMVSGEQALELAAENKWTKKENRALTWLVKSQVGLGQYESAVESYQEMIALDNIMDSLKQTDLTRELEARYRTEEKEKELAIQAERLKNQRTINIAFGLISLLLLGFGLFAYRNAQLRKRTNTQLRQLDRAKSRFFANMSHELRTPLTLIIAPIENAIEEVKSKNVKENLALAHSNSKKLLTLVNEILDLSKLESDKMRLIESAVSLEKLLRRIFFSYHSLAQLRGFILSFSYHLPKDLVLKIDIEKFEKVLNNLLSNAFKYSKPGGVITLRAEKEKGQLKIEISDTGKGIPPDQLDKIFDRFYQAEGENEPLQGGTGIGLAYAKEIARLFGGELQVESKIKEGSTFIFSLPLKKTSLRAIPLTEEGNVEDQEYLPVLSTPLSGNKASILIVEDNLEMSRFLVQSLSPYFQCSTAMDGEQALELLKTGAKPDLITSDVMMPNMDGFAFLEALHNIDDFQKTPFILLTARALEEDKLKGLHLGVDDYLTKPFSTKELIARIQNLLRNKTIRDQYQPEEQTQAENEGTFEDKFIKKAELLVLKNLSNTDYRIADFAKDLTYSPRQLERIFKKTTGFSPVGFIREVRLLKAYELLGKRQFASVAEVRFEVGIDNASYFSRKFQERFGKNPKEVMG